MIPTPPPPLSQKQLQKQRTKQLLIEKLKNMRIRSEGAPSVASVVSSAPILVPGPVEKGSDYNYDVGGEYRVGSQRDDSRREREREKKVEVKGKQLDGAECNQNQQQKQYKNQQLPVKKQQPNPQPPKNLPPTRIKRPYYQHYSKQGIFVPMLDYVRNHPNPSGKPPDIPAEMYEGIKVEPKRPWVYFGPENIPPSEGIEINEKTFSKIFEEAKKIKGSNAFRKSNKKKGGKNQDQISEVSDEFTSNFTFTDSVDLSKQSDLISQFRTFTKTNKLYDSGNAEQSQMVQNDDFSSVSGSVTQRHRYQLFDSSDSEEEPSSMQKAKQTRKFKKLVESSEEEGIGSSNQMISSVRYRAAGDEKGKKNKKNDGSKSKQKEKNTKQVKMEQEKSKKVIKYRKAKRQIDSD